MSCSKDTDLLADSVVSGTDAHLKRLVVDDSFLVSRNNTAILDVLRNDNFHRSSQVTIVDASTPSNGTVEINEDNTISYTADSDGTNTTDSFTYTAEVTNPSNSTTTEQGTVTVNVEGKIELSEKVLYWKEEFDKELIDQDGTVDYDEMMNLSTSGNRFQEYYYLYYYFDGVLSIWQATGDNKYLDMMLTIIDNTIQDADPIAFKSSYLGWKADSSYSHDYPENGVALWESYFFKGVTTLLRMMYKSPNLLKKSYKNGTYEDKFKSILSFTEQHIWNKWEDKGASYIYRNRTHMASHWARMGMDLYTITGKDKYLTVFENISYGTMNGYPSGTNLKKQFRQNPNVPGALVWDDTWNTVGSSVQDTPHASDIVTFIILAYENDMYWDYSTIDGLINTLDKVVFKASDGANYTFLVDGSGGYDVYGRLRDWVKLGRYDRNLQERLISQYQSNEFNARRYAIQNLANFALNEKLLESGKPVYPEIQ